MARTEAKLGIIGLTQYLAPEYWGWTEQEKQALDGGAAAVLQVVVQRLDAAGHTVEAAYGILHDKDEREAWDELRKELVKQPKPDHLHGVIRFVKGKGGTVEELAQVIGVEAQYVEKAGRGKYAFDNMLSYLTHVKYPEKHQYAPTEVVTIRGREYEGIDAERRDAWMKGRASIKAKKAKGEEAVDQLVEQALMGEVTHEQIMLTDELFTVYARNKRVIDEALETYGQRRATIAAKKLRDGEFTTTVIFVTGAPGSGKTHWARNYAEEQVAQTLRDTGERWRIYQAATGNPLDDWNGEEVLLLDDLRGVSMTATEWLLLLDPYNASPAAARYKNKKAVAPRMIILTSWMTPFQYFFFARQKGDATEAMDQFIRRLTAMIKVYKIDDDMRRFEVSSIDELPDKYQARVDTGDRVETLWLGYGFSEPMRYWDEADMSDALCSLVALRSPDLPLERGHGYDVPALTPTQAWAAAERRGAEDRERRVAADLQQDALWVVDGEAEALEG